MNMIKSAARMRCMLMTLTVASLSILAFCSDNAGTNRTILDAATLTETMWEGNKGVPFDLTATVILPLRSNQKLYAVRDETGTAILNRGSVKECVLQPGDRIHVTGSCDFDAMCKTISILSHGDIPQPEEITASGITEGRYDNHFVRLTGTVRDAFRDEIDPLWGFLVLQSGHESIYACFPSSEPEKAILNNLIGAEIAITGVCSTKITKPRLLSGRYIFFSERDTITVLRPAPADPFDVPGLYATSHTHHSIVSGMDRRRVAGRVIAVWHGDRMLVRTPDQHIVRVDLADRNPPLYGTSIEAVGTPETDLYRINLSRAIWRTNSLPEDVEPPPTDVTAKQLLTDWRGMPAMQTEYHGQAIRIKGLVRNLPSPESAYSRMALECGKYIIPVDANACPQALEGIDIGCKIEVSGICLIEIDNWRPNAPFPHIEGFSVIVRTPEDVRILSHPPWWTPGRLLAVIGALLIALAGVFVWNRSLNRLAERRGRELTEETLARVTASLKVDERTRLAIELHDSLSQNLTGAALEIETTETLINDNTEQAHRHLGIAAKTLKSCREELRNCLWDLRNDALGEKTMDAAIRRTLAPHVRDIDLAVRFNVPRERLSDNTAHALLRIIRELVQNAIRHGHAKTIKIAGGLESDRLLFSVQDDGCGFDPENHPGVLQGHFGLQGIRERVKQFNGNLAIKSKADKGTRVAISIKLTADT